MPNQGIGHFFKMAVRKKSVHMKNGAFRGTVSKIKNLRKETNARPIKYRINNAD